MNIKEKLREKLNKLLEKFVKWLYKNYDESDESTPTVEPEPTPEPEPSKPEPTPEPSKPEPAPTADPSQPKLNWCWGGFNGSKASETGKAQIKNLKVSNDGMSYAWAKGGCEALGAKSSTDRDNTIACLFLEDGRGGKFDWISTSRTTRDFKNIHGGYQGWSPSAFKSAKKVWFCIVGENGKYRTNLICATK